MTKRHYDWLIVGAGFTGAVLAHQLASQAGKRVLIIDRRDHIAGNAYDRLDENGVLFHQYGPHIFHTNAANIFDYLSQFTEWRPYEHRVVAMINGRLAPVPFNLTSLQICFSQAKADHLAARLVEIYGIDVKVPILKMREALDPDIRELAQFIYENVFLNYTTKQWDLTPEQLSPAVTGRVPVHVSYDDRYFQDTFQYMPTEGYSPLIGRMLAQDGVTIGTSEDYFALGSDISYDRMVFTGPIDQFFNFELGHLPYRSLNFEFRSIDQHNNQPCGTVNYPNEMAFTRITEQRHLTAQPGRRTVLTLEYPQAHSPGVTEPYYPIPRDENQALYRQYIQKAKTDAPEVIFAGRLGDYQYYNMDQAVGHALSIFRKRIIGAQDPADVTG
jgi:UDP-galactopyranose mutase